MFDGLTTWYNDPEDPCLEDGTPSLLTQLWRINIRPFKPESVEAYKKKQVREWSWNMPVQPTWKTRALLLGMGLSILFVIGKVVLYFHFNNLYTALTSIGPVYIHPMMTVGMVVTYLYLWRQYAHSPRMQPTWHRVELETYCREYPECPIPTLGFREAARVQWCIPEVKLYVDVLLSPDDRVLDPFIVAELDGEVHYIYVWNEYFRE